MEDPVPMITKRHFEVGLAHCRKSVNEVDLNRYDEFKRKFDPSFVSSQSDTAKIVWPDDDGKNSSNKKDDEELGLYD